MADLPNPNKMFKGKDLHPGQQIEAPWEPFWNCRAFATDNCNGQCGDCHLYDIDEGPSDEIELLCEAKW